MKRVVEEEWERGGRKREGVEEWERWREYMSGTDRLRETDR